MKKEWSEYEKERMEYINAKFAYNKEMIRNMNIQRSKRKYGMADFIFECVLFGLMLWAFIFALMFL